MLGVQETEDKVYLLPHCFLHIELTDIGNKEFPCGPCILRGDQERCHEVGLAEKNINASP